jgi:hypothetical protein
MLISPPPGLPSNVRAASIASRCLSCGVEARLASFRLLAHFPFDLFEIMRSWSLLIVDLIPSKAKLDLGVPA